MKSLMKISSRYVLTAAFITILVLTVNIAAVAAFMSQNMKNAEYAGMGRKVMEDIEQEMDKTGGACFLSEEGYRLLQQSSCIWAMRIDKEGDVVWEYALPPEIPHHYSLSEIAAFSRWYLKDYPVFVWKGGDSLMVYGMSQNLARFDFYGDMGFYGNLPNLFYLLIGVNLFLISLLALLFGFRFYQSLRPLAKGIEQLSEKEDIQLSEKGIVSDLAKQLNRTSVLLQTQNQQLERRDQARTEWIAGVSHDVRTPLSLIMGFSDDLRSSPKLDEEQHKKAEAICRQSQVIGDLIADLNLTVKLEYQSQPLGKEKLYPAKLLREFVAELYNQGVEETFQIVPVIGKYAEKIRIEADRSLLLRVFRNLIGNSIRHNPKGCEVQVHVGTEKNEITMLFSDSGDGIPKEVIAILEGKQEKKPEVHIMGLRVVTQIIKAHGGQVNFVSGKYGNYEVLIKLPAVE